MLREYETTFIVNGHLPTEEADGAVEKISKFIGENGGEVKSINRWGKRRLAYEIDKKQYGYYFTIRFSAEGTFIKELEKEFKMYDPIIRSLIIVVPKIVLRDEEVNREKYEKKIAELDSQEPEETIDDYDTDHDVPNENNDK